MNDLTTDQIEVEQKDTTFADAVYQIGHEYALNYAKFTAIRFAEWIQEEGWRNYDSSETWINLEAGSREVITTVDLYDRFEHRNDWKTKADPLTSQEADLVVQQKLS